MAPVLLCGEVRGRISALQRLLQALQKKGPFDCAFCLGNFFSSSQVLPFSTTHSNSSLTGESAAGANVEDFGVAVGARLAKEFGGAYEELQKCCYELPFPIYIVDEAASRCVERLERQREQFSHPGATTEQVTCGEAGEPAGPHRNDRDNAAISDTNGEQRGGSKPLLVPKTENGGVPGEDRPPPSEAHATDGAKQESIFPSAPHASAAGGASECTYTPLQLMKNVWLLAGAGVAELQGLRIAFYALADTPLTHSIKLEASDEGGSETSAHHKEGEDLGETFGLRLAGGWGGFRAFRGKTDILLTTRAPVGIFDGLPPEDIPVHPRREQEEQQQVEEKLGENGKESANGAIVETESTSQHCSAASCLADFLEPRHHICSGLGLFWQRPHFRGRHFGYSVRLLSLGVVGEKGPLLRAFHALQLRPISTMLQLLQHSSAAAAEQQQDDQTEEAMQEARAALFLLPPDSSTPNPYASASRDRRLVLPPSPTAIGGGPFNSLPGGGSRQQGPQRPPKRQRETGVVLVENLPFETTEGEALQEAMKQFGEVKFVFVPKDKADPTRGTGKAFVVYVDPKNAVQAAEASGQLEGGGRLLRMRLYYDNIPFDRPTGAKRSKCGEVINTEPHADCWFCLANPKVEKHMLVDIGNFLYSAIPKGGLVPQHLLLIPVAHLPSLAYADSETRQEANHTIARIRKAFHMQGLDLVVYERYVPMKATRAMHSQIHAIPCKRSDSLRASEFFKSRARRAGLDLQKLPPTADLSVLPEAAGDSRLGYFYVEIPGLCTAQGQTIDRYLHVQSRAESGKIPMNFGREVVAELIGEKNKMNWQTCVVSREEEELLADTMRSMIGSS